MIAPVTSATVERSNSSLHLIKSGFRSTMREDRLNALLLLFIQLLTTMPSAAREG